MDDTESNRTENESTFHTTSYSAENGEKFLTEPEPSDEPAIIGSIVLLLILLTVASVAAVIVYVFVR